MKVCRRLWVFDSPCSAWDQPKRSDWSILHFKSKPGTCCVERDSRLFGFSRPLNCLTENDYFQYATSVQAHKSKISASVPWSKHDASQVSSTQCHTDSSHRNNTITPQPNPDSLPTVIYLHLLKPSSSSYLKSRTSESRSTQQAALTINVSIVPVESLQVPFFAPAADDFQDGLKIHKVHSDDDCL